MSGQTSGQRQSSRYTQNAVNQLQQAQGQLLTDPNFLLGQGLGYTLGTNPYTFSPTVTQDMKNTGYEQAYGAYHGQQNQINEAATAAQGFRSGTTNMQQRHAAQDLGGQIANVNRTVDTQAALARPEDLVRAISAQGPILQQRFQFNRDIANAYVGAGSNPIWQQPSTASSIASGLGGLGGSLLTTGLSSGGAYSSPGFLRK